jgi:integrase
MTFLLIASEKMVERLSIYENGEARIKLLLSDYSVKENKFTKVFSNAELKKLKEYYEYFLAFEQGTLGTHRRFMYINQLYYARQIIGISLLDINEDNIQEVLSKLHSSDKSISTIKEYKKALRRFLLYREYGNENQYKKNVEGYPKIVRYLTTKTRSNDKKKITLDQMLTRKELEELMRNAKNPRDKALMGFIIESGARIGEILNIRIKDIVHENNPPHFIVKLEGKTGPRNINIIEHFRELSEWLSVHPLNNEKDFKDKPLWVNLQRDNKNMTYASARSIIKNIAKPLGLLEKTNPHNFRHTWATHRIQEGWTNEEVGAFLGWTKNSTMASVYVHTDGSEVLNKRLAKIKGVENVQTYSSDYLYCKKIDCNTLNAKYSDICYNCKTPLNEDNKKIYSNVSAELMSAIQLILKHNSELVGHTIEGKVMQSNI